MKILYNCKRLIRAWWNKRETMSRLRHDNALKRRVDKRQKRLDKERAYRSEYRKQKKGSKNLPGYLENNKWEKELNLKMWSTKGARFQAARRCEDKDSNSQTAIAWLTALLIILGLVPFLPQAEFKPIPTEILSISITAVSIMLLAYSLLISAKGYGLQAYRFHECSLQIGALYNALRQAKEWTDDVQKRVEIARISAEYDALLPHYPNHRPIDFAIFQTSKPNYYKMSKVRTHWLPVSYYLHTKCLLHAVIIGSLAICGAMFWWSKI